MELGASILLKVLHLVTPNVHILCSLTLETPRKTRKDTSSLTELKKTTKEV